MRLGWFWGGWPSACPSFWATSAFPLPAITCGKYENEVGVVSGSGEIPGASRYSPLPPLRADLRLLSTCLKGFHVFHVFPFIPFRFSATSIVSFLNIRWWLSDYRNRE